MDENREAWIRHSDVREERERLSNALKGWWNVSMRVAAHLAYPRTSRR